MSGVPAGHQNIKGLFELKKNFHIRSIAKIWLLKSSLEMIRSLAKITQLREKKRKKAMVLIASI
jgi:hypothetical protein